MATPSDQGPIKKPGSNPQAGPPSGKPPSPAARPGAPKPPPGKATPPPKGVTPNKPDKADKAAKPDKAAGKAGPRKPAAKGGGARKLGQVLVDLGFIDENQQWEVLDEAKTTGQRVGEAALARGLINEEQLLQALAEQHNLKVINLGEAKPTADALTAVPETMASVYKVVPLTYRDGVLTIAIGDPNNLGALDDLRNLLSCKEVVALLSTPAAIAEVLAKCYLGKEESIMDVISAIEQDPDLAKGRKAETSIDLEQELTDSAPVRKLINMVFLLGIKDRASDIHFEPFEDEYKMRYRCDGILYEMVPPPRHLANAIASRIKVMSNLNIAERRLPQDGRIELNVGGNPVDMRVSVLPTMFGESVVIRVLDRTVVSLDLNKLGMQAELLSSFRHLISKPNGIVLVTGPTGAGKTTTLYSALNELNVISDKIITTEDPVEYDIDGIIQVPINHDIGLTFAAALRSILRQDPDKILVGEIRDLETAQIAVQASLTGHTVFSTLHTNDAPGAIVRLRDMGMEPYLITATVEGVMAQRLVRKICEDCRVEFEPSAEMLMELSLTPQDVKGKKFYYGRGCDRCNNTGHRGRMGIYELVIMNDDLRDLISQGASTDELRASCRRSGMITLRESGMRAIYMGATTIEEVVRETILEDA
jgi:type IV pilus assembly protein PilB